jgi:hypothetical protein
MVQSTLLTVKVTNPPAPSSADPRPESWQSPIGTAGRTTTVTPPLRVSSPALPLPASRASADATRPDDDAPAAPVSALGVTPSAPVATAAPEAEPPPVDSRRAIASSTADDMSRQKEIVLAVLREYSRAYDRLDVRATKAVYPSIDDRQLQRLFQALQEQRVRFASCDVSISSSGADANASCRGDATYRPKVGRTVRVNDSEWTFSLSRGGSGWQILDARMQ